MRANGACGRAVASCRSLSCGVTRRSAARPGFAPNAPEDRPLRDASSEKHMSDTKGNGPSSAQGVDQKAAAGFPVAPDSVTAHGSESENPAIYSPTAKTGVRPRGNRDWWPNQVDLSVLHAHSPKGNPLGEDFS